MIIRFTPVGMTCRNCECIFINFILMSDQTPSVFGEFIVISCFTFTLGVGNNALMVAGEQVQGY